SSPWCANLSNDCSPRSDGLLCAPSADGGLARTHRRSTSWEPMVDRQDTSGSSARSSGERNGPSRSTTSTASHVTRPPCPASTRARHSSECAPPEPRTNGSPRYGVPTISSLPGSEVSTDPLGLERLG